MCPFCRIVSDPEGATIVFHDGRLAAFPSARPMAPVHILIVPCDHVETLNEAPGRLIGEMAELAKEIATDAGISSSGYRISVNCNDGGGQTIYHLHMHLLGGGNIGTTPLVRRR